MLGRLQNSDIQFFTKAQSLTTKSVCNLLYYGKVGKELTLQVYTKER